MSRKNLSLCLLVLVLLCSCALKAGAAEKGNLIEGDRVSFSQQPRWTISGAWSGDGERLFLVDVLENSILEYDASGGLVDTIADRGFSLPVLIHSAESGYLWLEDEDGRLLLVDDRFQTQRVVDLKKEVTSPLGSLISVSGWVPLGPSSLLVFGDIKQGQEATGAILRVPLDTPSRFEILRKTPIESAAHRFFLLGQPYLAGVGGKPFFAMLGETPEVFDADGKGFRLVRTTKQGKQLLTAPQLPKQVTISTTALLFQRLEAAAYPAGIYGWKNSLYVLMRTPTANASTWSLLKINPETFEVVWNRRIATTANHLLVIPGEKYWAFVEKGPVKGPGNQAVRSFLRVPTAVVEQ